MYQNIRKQKEEMNKLGFLGIFYIGTILKV